MTVEERLADLERRIREQEIRVAARIDAVLEAMAASQGVSIDALALLALRDRDLVDSLLRIRRLACQKAGSDRLSLLMLERYEMALEIADQLASARPLGPQ